MKNLRARLFLATLCAQLIACGGTPPRLLPVPQEAALQLEQDGAKRYARGEFLAASARFAGAARLFTAIDDPAAARRNTLHWARAELAAGQPEAALAPLDRLSAADPSLQPDLLALRAQAQLALGQTAAARTTLTTAFAACRDCPQLSSLHLLASRLALDENRATEALTHAISAAGLLDTKKAPAETANAWRLTAEARLAMGEGIAALSAAETALDIDRQLARPEKIVRDWLLIGDARKLGAGGTPGNAREAYRRALEIALAATENRLADQARERLAGLEIKTSQ